MNNSGDMDGMAMGPPSNGTGGGRITMNHQHMMMHVTFFWEKSAEILFSGWPPGYDNLGMYILALVIVFSMAVFVEFLSSSNYINESNVDHVIAGLLQTILYGLRIGLAYVVMLAVMSFNVGVFLVAIVGRLLGFLVFGRRVSKKSSYELLLLINFINGCIV
ncbi:copper transporter 6-like [Capsicum galapagoense]